jgi:hypothetical protein
LLQPEAPNPVSWSQIPSGKKPAPGQNRQAAEPENDGKNPKIVV